MSWVPQKDCGPHNRGFNLPPILGKTFLTVLPSRTCSRMMELPAASFGVSRAEFRRSLARLSILRPRVADCGGRAITSPPEVYRPLEGGQDRRRRMISSSLNWLPLFPFALVVSPFLIDAFLVSPETEKAQPGLTDWVGSWFMAEWIPPPIALIQMTFHLLSVVVCTFYSIRNSELSEWWLDMGMLSG